MISFGWEHTPVPLKDPNGKVKPHFYVDDVQAQIKNDGSGDTVGVIKGKKDLYEEIQADRANCGLAYVMSLVDQGRLDIKKLEDDVDVNGDYGGNFTRPTMVSEVAPIIANDANSTSDLDAIAKKLGVSRQDLLNAGDISDLVKAKMAPAAPAPEPEGGK